MVDSMGVCFSASPRAGVPMVFSFKSPLCLSQAHKGQSFDHQTPGMGNLTAERYPVRPQAAHQRHVHSEGGVGTVSEPCPHSICVFQQLPPTSGGKNLLVRKTEERKRSSEKGKSTEADSHRCAWLLHIVGLGILGQVNEPIKEGLI